MTCRMTPALPFPLPLAPASGMTPLWLDWTSQASDAGARFARLPFDAARAQYASAVRAGWVERSMLASREVERTLATLEQLTLGPWARQV